MWILFIILSIIILIGFIPVGINIVYNKDGFFIKILLGFIKIPLGVDEHKNEEKEVKTKKLDKFGGDIKEFIKYIPLAIETLKKFIRNIKISPLRFHIVFGGEDKADVAKMFAGASIAAGMVVPLFDNVFKIIKREITFNTDFSANNTTIYFDSIFKISIGRIVVIAVVALSKFLKIYKMKGGSTNDGKA